jgi:hypothetical protein
LNLSPTSLVSILAVLGLLGCGQIDGLQGSPGMRPGKDCLQCHSVDGGSSFPTLSVAGTVFRAPDAPPSAGLPEAEILVRDALGKELTLRSNGAGNFYTAEVLKPPLRVAAQWGRVRMTMLESPPSGACNSCHQTPAPVLASAFAAPPGRIFIPPAPGKP